MTKTDYQVGDKVELTPEGHAEAAFEGWQYASPLELGKTYTVSGLHQGCLVIKVADAKGRMHSCYYNKAIFK